jgi:hypothetical protein
MVDTKKTLRRKIQYANLDELVADAQRLVSLDATTTGNWSAGQIFEHLARVMEKSIDGFVTPPLPWIVRLGLRIFLKNKILNQPMSPGFKLPKRAEAEIVADLIDEQKSLAHLKRAVSRLKSETERKPSPFLGQLTLDEWNQLHTRHAEMHMSFLAEP